MSKNKCVYYELQPEVIGEPSLKLDGEDNNLDIKQFASIIHGITGIPEDNLEDMICRFGIEKVLNSPSLLNISKDQEQKLKEIAKLIVR